METVFFIENKKGEWWTGNSWTIDPLKAMKFNKHGEAGMFAEVFDIDCYNTTEHIFLDQQEANTTNKQ